MGIKSTQHHFWTLFIVLGLFSCKQDNHRIDTDKETELIVTIEHLPGDNFSYELDDRNTPYISYPFHVAYIKGQKSNDLKCILLSKKLSARRSVGIKVIAVFRFIEFGIEKTYIVAVPKDDALKSIEIIDFEDFVTKHDSVRQIIETWLLNQCGTLGCANKIAWENEFAALNYLEKDNNKK